MSVGALLTLAACSGMHAQSPEAVSAKGEEKVYELTLLHINDHHSHLDENTVPLMLDTGGSERERVLVTAGGFARVASTMKALAAQSAGAAIKIHAGDAVTGDLYYSLTDGQADADLMNTVCFDAMTLGNHEFDHGDAALKRFIDRLHGGSCRTPVLSANVRFGPDSALNPSRAPGLVQPSVIVERHGRRIGLVGITVADKTRNASRPDPGTAFLDEAASAQAEIDALARQGVDIIVLQTHYGYQADLALARRLRGVDAIVGGDSHTLLGPAALKAYGLTPVGPYPTRVTDLDGKPVCVVQAGQYAYVVGELKLRFDDSGELLACEGRPHILIGDDFRRGAQDELGALSAAEKQAIEADVARSGALRISHPDAEAKKALAPHQTRKLEYGSVIVARTEETLCARRVPGTRGDRSRSSQGDACNASARVTRHGGDIQQLVAQAYLEQAKPYFDADLALINAGGVRIDLPAGPLTVKDVHTLLPFKNTLVQLKIPGSLLKAALESAVDAALAQAPSTGAFPYAAGMRWRVDAGRAEGDRLFGLEVLEQNGRYAPLDPDRVYSVATIDFIAEGKDHYSPFERLRDGQRVDVGLDATQLFLDYVRASMRAGRGLRPLPPEKYSTQAFIAAP
ncbi:bifunctional metallophosphatase/5'-nucleotidase [Pusillimonas sp.]|uniref:bifunctional metallophosphatase/5'-nucleotidase n=1 Tax=Pusillimonas sp. TaxID=3040095 RepID=UPI0029ADD41D|nr:5'-nucleotidase C-terminal domain-containing protein [Pusillimonas sp.]MDX3893360.1 5'-nucleotidase C-terminal domain-containing protein [Pusillimonas sp.]